MPKKINVYKNESRGNYKLSEHQREIYRQTSRAAIEAKHAAQHSSRAVTEVAVNKPRLKPIHLMPKQKPTGLTDMSLFSGGGGLDLGFERAGLEHVASYELIPICGETLRTNRRDWTVYAGPEEGDVTLQDWKPYKGQVSVLHGGPPCQPFSIAGQQQGGSDNRNMWGEFIRAINEIKPEAFVAENVPGMLQPKFRDFVSRTVLSPLSNYHIHSFHLIASDFGVPQMRKRVFFVGFRSKKHYRHFETPQPTHRVIFGKSAVRPLELFEDNVKVTMGVRESLGLAEIGYDALAPTLRSAFTGKRNTTSVLNSSAGQAAWAKLGIWPNGVQLTRYKAATYPNKNNHFRLSVQDCAVLQGFPASWKFSGATYQILGQIGNSVAPPVSYAVATSVVNAVLGN